MPGRIGSILGKDIKISRRDSIITYLIVGPFLLALLMRLVVPLAEGVPLVFAVAEDVDPAVRASLESKGEVVALPDREAVVERVLAVDDVPGFVPANGTTEIVLEGNEVAYVKDLAELALEATALEQMAGAPDVAVESRGETRQPVRAITAALLAFSVLLVSGLAIGFSILDEKESDTIRAFAVTPLRFSEYLIAKLSAGSVLGLVMALGATLVVTGLDVPLGPLLLAILASLPVGLMLGFIVGAFAASQLSAMAMLKGLLFFFTSVPVAGFFLKGKLAWVLAPFPNHWSVQAIFAALTGGSLLVPAVLTFGLGLAALSVVLVLLRQRLGLGRFHDLAAAGRQAAAGREAAAGDAKPTSEDAKPTS